MVSVREDCEVNPAVPLPFVDHGPKFIDRRLICVFMRNMFAAIVLHFVNMSDQENYLSAGEVLRTFGTKQGVEWAGAFAVVLGQGQ